MGGVHQGLGGANPPPVILLGAMGGAKPPPHALKRFNILIPWRLRPIIAPAESTVYYPLFSPPMNWIILSLAPHELKPNSVHAPHPTMIFGHYGYRLEE